MDTYCQPVSERRYLPRKRRRRRQYKPGSRIEERLHLSRKGNLRLTGARAPRHCLRHSDTRHDSHDRGQDEGWQRSGYLPEHLNGVLSVVPHNALLKLVGCSSCGGQWISGYKVPLHFHRWRSPNSLSSCYRLLPRRGVRNPLPPAHLPSSRRRCRRRSRV